MFKSLNLQAGSVAVLVTAATLGGMNLLADQQYGSAARDWELSQAQPAMPSVHQVVVVGTRASQQVAVTQKHKRG